MTSADPPAAQEIALESIGSLRISSPLPSPPLTEAASTPATVHSLAFFDLLPDELLEAIIEQLQDDYRRVRALGQCDRRLASLVRSKRWQVIDVRHYTSAVALQELQKHADLVRRVVIRTEDSLSPYLKVLTIQFDTVRDCVRPPIEHQNLIGEPEALFDLLMRLLEQKGDVEDPVDRVPWALLCCHVLRHLSLELPTARLHSTYSTLNANSVASELTRIELCCNAISLEGIIAFLVSPAAANLVSIKIKASLVGVPADFQPVLLTRLERLELATIARGSRRDSATDWPAFALPHLIDLSTPLKILILQSLSPQRIYCALTSFERAQPVKTLKHVRILAANEYWSTRCSSDFEALADELRNWTAQTGVKTEVIL